MASAEETDFFDIYNFELQLREKINELQWKSESLEETQRELSETRRTLYETQSQLEDERRSSTQLGMQLRTTLETVRRLEDESIKNQTQQIRMKMQCETAAIERDVLIEQARITRLENIDLKIKIQEYERSIASTKITNETLEASMMELKNSVTRLHAKLHSNVGKLEREQEQLRNSFKVSVNFGKRVQETLKNSHAARERDKRTIEKLKRQVAGLDTSCKKSIPVPVPAPATDIGSSHQEMESTLRELRKKLESTSIEDKLSLICAELQKTDRNFAKD